MQIRPGFIICSKHRVCRRVNYVFCPNVTGPICPSYSITPSYVIQSIRPAVAAGHKRLVFRTQHNPENCTLMGYHAARSGNSLPTFRDNLSVPSGPLKIWPIGRLKTSVRNYNY